MGIVDSSLQSDSGTSFSHVCLNNQIDWSVQSNSFLSQTLDSELNVSEITTIS